MPETTYLGFTLREILTALSFLLGFLLLAWFINWVLIRIVREMAERTGTALDNLLVDRIRRPIYIGLILRGLYLAAASLPLTGRVENGVVKGGGAAFAALGI